jgi:hypothetical protein
MHALDSGLIPQQATQRPHLMVTTSLETLRGLPGACAAELELSALPISARTVERLACDASITRIVLGSDSMVIDVGRAKRTISGAARKVSTSATAAAHGPAANGRRAGLQDTA